jgi:hypothetical protein
MNIDIDELRQFMKNVVGEHGEFTVFGLFLRDEAPDKWDLVVSAPWLEEGKLKALGEFAKELSEAIGEDKVMSLSRIVTLNADDPALDAIVRLGVSGGTVELRDTNVFGLKIKHAYILRAKRPQPEPSSAT